MITVGNLSLPAVFAPLPLCYFKETLHEQPFNKRRTGYY